MRLLALGGGLLLLERLGFVRVNAFMPQNLQWSYAPAAQSRNTDGTVFNKLLGTVVHAENGGDATPASLESIFGKGKGVLPWGCGAGNTSSCNIALVL